MAKKGRLFMYLSEASLREAIPNHCSVRDLAKTFGVSGSVIYARVNQYGLSLDELKEQEEIGPTPEEMAERIAEVQAKWSPRERRSRIAGGAPQRWTPPRFRSGTLERV